MKKLLLIIYLIAPLAIAQSISVQYKSRFIIDDALKTSLPPSAQNLLESLEKGENYSLLIDGNKTLYFPTKEFNTFVEKKTKKDEKGNIENSKTIGYKNPEIIYKDLSKNEIVSQIELVGKTYLIKEEISNLTWTIGNTTENIGEFTCQKATAIIDTDIVEAWFTNQIPIPQGPSNYYNLPGLILQVKINKKLITATKVSYDKTDANLIIPPTKGKPISRIEYKKIQNKISNVTPGTTVTKDGNTTTKRTVIKY